MKIARFDKRILAWLLDEAFPCTTGIVFYILASTFNVVSDSGFTKFAVSCVIAYSLYILITSLILVLTNGFSIGGAILGIRVLRKDGNNLHFKECFLKTIAEGVVPYCLVNAVYMLANHTERSTFDRLTDTLVTEYRHAND